MDVKTQVEQSFLALSGEDREAIISLGTTLRLSYLRKRLFLAESKVQHFEEQYGVTLTQLEAEGLPDNADHRLHEDYVMWHHWVEVADKIKPDVASLEDIARYGLYLGGTPDAGD